MNSSPWIVSTRIGGSEPQAATPRADNTDGQKFRANLVAAAGVL
jgi:hypothetical protein